MAREGTLGSASHCATRGAVRKHAGRAGSCEKVRRRRRGNARTAAEGRAGRRGQMRQSGGERREGVNRCGEAQRKARRTWRQARAGLDGALPEARAWRALTEKFLIYNHAVHVEINTLRRRRGRQIMSNEGKHRDGRSGAGRRVYPLDGAPPRVGRVAKNVPPAQRVDAQGVPVADGSAGDRAPSAGVARRTYRTPSGPRAADSRRTGSAGNSYAARSAGESRGAIFFPQRRGNAKQLCRAQRR